MSANPIRQFGLLARFFSSARDVSNDRNPRYDIGASERQDAYQAEMLLTLQAQLAEEDIDVAFTPSEGRLVVQYPDGILSLPGQYQYTSRRPSLNPGLN